MHFLLNLLCVCCLLIAGLFVSAQSIAPTPRSTYPFTVTVTGTAKPAILFLPGFACSGAVWDESLPAFTSRYSCHVFTMAGFAGTPAEKEPTLLGWVESLAAYIRDKGLERPAIVGHSLGGMIALLIAAKHPDLVSRIIVVDALPCLNALGNPAFTVQENPHCEESVEKFRQLTKDQFLLQEKFFIPGMIADTIHRSDIIRWGEESDRTTYASIYCQFNNTDLRDTIKSIRCPALILLEAPFATMKPSVEQQYARLTTASFRYATKGLHFIMFDDKEWYLKQIVDFL